MESNKFICRGISKETNEFVYGYYIKLFDKHYIIDESKLLEEYKTSYDMLCLYHLGIEIIQKPDKWFCNINNQDIYESDILKSDGEIIEIFYDNDLGGFMKDIIDCKQTCTSCLPEDLEDYKIIGNTHFNNLTVDKNV